VQPFCPALELVDTHAHQAATSFHDKIIKPDVMIYSRDCPRIGTSDIRKAEILCEFKFYPSDDPFRDDGFLSFEHDTAAARDTLGQITLYATAHMSARFVTYVFFILVFLSYARVLRWDRSGVVVTEKTRLTESSFAEFLRRFNDARPEERGIDTSVTMDLNNFGLDPQTVRSRLGIDNSTPLARMDLGKGCGSYIVGTPTYMGTASPTGRSTRTFKAICEKTHDIVFLRGTQSFREDAPCILESRIHGASSLICNRRSISFTRDCRIRRSNTLLVAKRVQILRNTSQRHKM
jgi:hypothetical protein